MNDEITRLKLTHAMLREEAERTIARLEIELANACADGRIARLTMAKREMKRTGYSPNPLRKAQ